MTINKIKFGIELLVMRTSKSSTLHPHRTEFYRQAIRGRLSQLEKVINKSEYRVLYDSSAELINSHDPFLISNFRIATEL